MASGETILPWSSHIASLSLSVASSSSQEEWEMQDLIVWYSFLDTTNQKLYMYKSVNCDQRFTSINQKFLSHKMLELCDWVCVCNFLHFEYQ